MDCIMSQSKRDTADASHRQMDRAARIKAEQIARAEREQAWRNAIAAGEKCCEPLRFDRFSLRVTSGGDREWSGCLRQIHAAIYGHRTGEKAVDMGFLAAKFVRPHRARSGLRDLMDNDSQALIDIYEGFWGRRHDLMDAIDWEIGDMLYIHEVELDVEFRGHGVGLLAVDAMIGCMPLFKKQAQFSRHISLPFVEADDGTIVEFEERIVADDKGRTKNDEAEDSEVIGAHKTNDEDGEGQDGEVVAKRGDIDAEIGSERRRKYDGRAESEDEDDEMPDDMHSEDDDYDELEDEDDEMDGMPWDSVSSGTSEDEAADEDECDDNDIILLCPSTLTSVAGSEIDHALAQQKLTNHWARLGFEVLGKDVGVHEIFMGIKMMWGRPEIEEVVPHLIK